MHAMRALPFARRWSAVIGLRVGPRCGVLTERFGKSSSFRGSRGAKSSVGLGWIGVFLLVAGCQTSGASEAPQVPEAPATPLRLKAVQVQMLPWPRVVRVQGSLLADEHAVVGAKVAGRVKQVKVDLGDPVRQGDLLVVLDTEDLDLRVKQAEAQLEQARAELGLKPGEDEQHLDRRRVPAVLQEEAVRNEAKANLDRAISLAQQAAISKEELQQRQAAFEVAEARCRSAMNDVEEQLALIGVRRAELALAQQNREDADVRAPFSGVIQQRHVAPGTYLAVGQPVVSLVRIDPLRFRGGVPEREAMQVRLDQEVTIKVEGQAAPIHARVSRMAPALEAASRALLVEADVPNPGGRLQVGLFAEAQIVVDPHARTLAVPASAVVEFAGVEKVWRIRRGEAAEQIVLTGRREANRVEILRGLSAGDVVAADARSCRAGPVQIEN